MKTYEIAYVVSAAQLKEMVHPKKKILSSFTHPQVVLNLHEFLLNTKGNILASLRLSAQIRFCAYPDGIWFE